MTDVVTVVSPWAQFQLDDPFTPIITWLMENWLTVLGIWAGLSIVLVALVCALIKGEKALSGER